MILPLHLPMCWYWCGTISGSCCFLIEEMNFDFYHKDSCVAGRCNSCVWGSGWGEARQHLLSLCNPEHLVNKQIPEERRNNRTAMPRSSVDGCNLIVIVVTAVLITQSLFLANTQQPRRVPSLDFVSEFFLTRILLLVAKTLKTQNVYESYTKLFAQTILTFFLRRGIRKNCNISEPHDRVFPTGQQGTYNVTHCEGRNFQIDLPLKKKKKKGESGWRSKWRLD